MGAKTYPLSDVERELGQESLGGSKKRSRPPTFSWSHFGRGWTPSRRCRPVRPGCFNSSPDARVPPRKRRPPSWPSPATRRCASSECYGMSGSWSAVVSAKRPSTSAPGTALGDRGSAGASTLADRPNRVSFVCVVPKNFARRNAVSAVIRRRPITIGGIIVAEASLSFLGFGLPPSVPSSATSYSGRGTMPADCAGPRR